MQSLAHWKLINPDREVNHDNAIVYALAYYMRHTPRIQHNMKPQF